MNKVQAIRWGDESRGRRIARFLNFVIKDISLHLWIDVCFGLKKQLELIFWLGVVISREDLTCYIDSQNSLPVTGMSNDWDNLSIHLSLFTMVMRELWWWQTFLHSIFELKPFLLVNSRKVRLMIIDHIYRESIVYLQLTQCLPHWNLKVSGWPVKILNFLPTETTKRALNSIRFPNAAAQNSFALFGSAMLHPLNLTELFCVRASVHSFLVVLETYWQFSPLRIASSNLLQHSRYALLRGIGYSYR